MTPNHTTALQFLGHLWPEPVGVVGIFTLPDPASWFGSDTQAIAKAAVANAAHKNVYICAGAYSTKPAVGRGTEDMVIAIPGLWADVDIKGEAHKAENLPPDMDAALTIVSGVGVLPTLVVDSGHGIQAWWLFKEPWVFDTDAERLDAKQLSKRWQSLLRSVARDKGWTIDGTADLCRVLRVPGTINHKIIGSPKPVWFQEIGPRYDWTELKEIVSDIHVSEPSTSERKAAKTGPPADLLPIIEGCAWMRHCRDDAATLSEPQWYQMLTVVACCDDAHAHAHALSAPYPNYTAAETDAKLKQAIEKSPGPVTCRFVETEFEFGDPRFCLSCPHQGKIKSPVTLGRQAPVIDLWAADADLLTERPTGPSHAEEQANVDEPESDLYLGVKPKPAPMGQVAHRGLLGRLVDLVSPHTEADPNWLLLLGLTCAGSAIGRTVYIQRGGDRHYTNLYACAIGTTGVGRKGSAFSPIADFFKSCDPDWSKRIVSGLSSGEGLIYAVRDPITRLEKKKGKGSESSMVEEVADPGEPDKRLLVYEGEFRNALNVMGREGNTLSPIVRSAWETGSLRSLVKNLPTQATDAHITIAGNITPEELKTAMTKGEIDNGFANRFIWAWSERSRVLPSGGRMWEIVKSDEYQGLQREFNNATWHIHNLVSSNSLRFNMTEDASDIWGVDGVDDAGLYVYLTRQRNGILAKLTNRAAPIVLRLALIYAVLDCAHAIDTCHLDAALEVWRYCEDTCLYVFGASSGDRDADAILSELHTAGRKGMSRKDISSIFNRHRTSDQIKAALRLLSDTGLAVFRQARKGTRGPFTETWYAAA